MRRILGLLAAAALVAACGTSEGGASGRTRIVASFYPLAFVAAEVAGNGADVANLSPPGVEPHDLELDAGQIRELAEADLVVYLGGGFQPAVEKALGELDATATFDALAGQELPAGGEDPHADEEGQEAEGEEHTDEGVGRDPHVWLDPTRLAGIATAVAERLAEVDTGNASLYEANAGKLAGRLSELDADYRTALSSCSRNELIVTHEAFGYLTNRYGLVQVGIAGLDPESEPDPGRVADVAEFARDHGVTTIFFERAVSPEIAETIAEEIGVRTNVLDPLEFPPENGGDYLSVMRANLDAITDALGCRG